eukprot:s1164_g17.t2
MQFETLGTAPTGAVTTARVATVPLAADDDDTDESTVDVILGSLPFGRRFACRASQAQVRDCTEPPTAGGVLRGVEFDHRTQANSHLHLREICHSIAELVQKVYLEAMSHVDSAFKPFSIQLVIFNALAEYQEHYLLNKRMDYIPLPTFVLPRGLSSAITVDVFFLNPVTMAFVPCLWQPLQEAGTGLQARREREGSPRSLSIRGGASLGVESHPQFRGLRSAVVSGLLLSAFSRVGLGVTWYLRRQRRLRTVLAAIDSINWEDPREDDVQRGEEKKLPESICGSPGTRPKEWLYGQRMSRRLKLFAPWASHVVQVAARAQHVKRWVSERRSYPEGTAGYKKQDLGKMHAQIAKEEMLKAGYGEKEASRVTKLLTKQDIKGDKEVQLLEDVICLVFLEFYWFPFSQKHAEPQKDAMGEEKLLDIVKKTWVKMSDKGHAAALELPLPEKPKALILKALS